MPSGKRLMFPVLASVILCLAMYPRPARSFSSQESTSTQDQGKEDPNKAATMKHGFRRPGKGTRFQDQVGADGRGTTCHGKQCEDPFVLEGLRRPDTRRLRELHHCRLAK